MRAKGSNTVWAGLGLISLGVAFIVAQLMGWDKIWPIFPVVGGLAFFLVYLTGMDTDPGLVFVATAALLIGLLFFGFTFGLWEWGDMSRLWPVFPLIGGIAFLALFLAQGHARDFGVLGVGIVAIIVGLVGLAVTHGYLDQEIVQYWPLLLVILGLFGLLTGVIQFSRKK